MMADVWSRLFLILIWGVLKGFDVDEGNEGDVIVVFGWLAGVWMLSCVKNECCSFRSSIGI